MALAEGFDVIVVNSRVALQWVSVSVDFAVVGDNSGIILAPTVVDIKAGVEPTVDVIDVDIGRVSIEVRNGEWLWNEEVGNGVVGLWNEEVGNEVVGLSIEEV